MKENSELSPPSTTYRTIPIRQATWPDPVGRRCRKFVSREPANADPRDTLTDDLGGQSCGRWRQPSVRTCISLMLRPSRYIAFAAPPPTRRWTVQQTYSSSLGDASTSYRKARMPSRDSGVARIVQ